MYKRSSFARLRVLVGAVLLFSAPIGSARASPETFDTIGSMYQEILNKAEEGREGKLTGFHVYYKDGLHLDSRRDNFRLRIGTEIMFDGGYIDADRDLQGAFPDLEGSATDFRKFSVSASGTIKAFSATRGRLQSTGPVFPGMWHGVTSHARPNALEFKIEVDFANVLEIKDNWIRFPQIPLLRHFKFGHMQEPFSLERQTSFSGITFMERALPVDAFAPSRNIGVRYDGTAVNERIAWGAGWFLNTGSLASVGEAKDRMSEANGYDVAVRVTGLPWYQEEDGRLLHLGLSYGHGVRESQNSHDRTRFRARPESRITDERLVNTGQFFVDKIDLINPELAIVSGPLSFQGEYFHALTNADARGDPKFWGFYAYGSYFLTGEHRDYDTSRGVFLGLDRNMPSGP